MKHENLRCFCTSFNLVTGNVKPIFQFSILRQNSDIKTTDIVEAVHLTKIKQIGVKFGLLSGG